MRALRLLAWLALLATSAGLAFAWLWPSSVPLLGEGDWRRPWDSERVVAFLHWVSFTGRTFTPHAGLALFALVAVAALLRARRAALVAALVATACAWPWAWSYRPRTAPALDPGAALVVMTTNVEYGRADDARLLAEIDRAAPDLLLIQEYTPEMHERLGPALRRRFPHAAPRAQEGAFGMATYSRLPFVTEPEHFPRMDLRHVTTLSRDHSGAAAQGAAASTPEPPPEPPPEPQIRAVVRLAGRDVVVQNFHPYPPTNPANVLRHRSHTRGLLALARADPRPTILAGDFNFTANAVTSAWLRDAGFRDAWDDAGRGPGFTWPDRSGAREHGLTALLPVRIDRVLVSGGLIADRAEVGPSIGADHRPVVVRVGFPPATPAR